MAELVSVALLQALRDVFIAERQAEHDSKIDRRLGSGLLAELNEDVDEAVAVGFLQGGGIYIKGGSQVLSDRLVDRIRVIWMSACRSLLVLPI